MRQRHTLFFILLVCLIAGAGFFVIQKNHSRPTNSLPASASISIETSTPEPQALPVLPTYHTVTLESTAPIAELTEKVGKEQVPVVLALNRIDTRHIQVGAVLTVPDSSTDFLTLTPFPTNLPSVNEVPKIIFVSQKIQAFAAYEYGTLVRWGPVSTGKKSTPTASKLYYTNWKGKLITSTIDDGWIMPWYFNLDNQEGISMHQYDLPGYPASHSCVRLAEADAEWMYTWAEQWILDKKTGKKLANGTPTIVFGTYAYSETAPWKLLPTDQNATVVTTEDLEETLAPYLSDIQASVENRIKILNPDSQ
ncbi:MAG TPA: L,D-transpeptidase family protein [Candidatus Paceibacterota bacterium]|nr:L,D-transpeptidase family protein [Candidatus Paceibacterota bacterium]